jgi:hypothetical protein
MANGSDVRDEFAIIAGDREFHPEFGEVPKSKGVPRSLTIAVSIGIVMIFLIGAGVILNSGYGHHWPWNSTLTVPLK